MDSAEWQPITTAPKDGTQILATNGLNTVVIFWHTESKSWTPSINPIHWIPIPHPPAQEERKC